jgi:hypothetical protein
MAEKKICFTVASDATKLTVKSVQIGDEEKINIDRELTGENVGDIASIITSPLSAYGSPNKNVAVPVANSGAESVASSVPVAASAPVASSVPVASSEPEPEPVVVTVPETAPVANSVIAASTTPANVPVVNLSPDVALNELKTIPLSSPYNDYTLGSLIDDLKRSDGQFPYGRGQLLEFITTNAVDWKTNKLDGKQITNAIIAGVTYAGQSGDNWNIGFNKKGPRVRKLVLGGSHLTRKSSYNRRRRQSTTRKGRRSSRRRR